MSLHAGPSATCPFICIAAGESRIPGASTGYRLVGASRTSAWRRLTTSKYALSTAHSSNSSLPPNPGSACDYREKTRRDKKERMTKLCRSRSVHFGGQPPFDRWMYSTKEGIFRSGWEWMARGFDEKHHSREAGDRLAGQPSRSQSSVDAMMGHYQVYVQDPQTIKQRRTTITA
ncbi:hypothetical protein LX36DRAFT_176287 [Colletotrichum falcatum]|nr:hypothetical protein LX36DRAFT_176287 [Colletotrichum falcatum]